MLKLKQQGHARRISVGADKPAPAVSAHRATAIAKASEMGSPETRPRLWN